MIVVVNFQGGLGNQLFQYAAARSLIKKNDILKFNVGDYGSNQPGRNFSLLQYKVKGTVLADNFINNAFVPQTKINRLVNRLGLFHSIKEQGFFIHSNLAEQCKLFTTIQGYWQSEEYFNSIRAELLSELVPVIMPVLPNMMQQQNTVAVHVRRTDYLNDDRYGFLGESYYRNAIRLLKQQLNNPVFVFFSDDQEWCKQTFAGEHVLFCEDDNWQTDYLQLYLMSKCKHQIIANSSFSWWGAWLNINEKKIVIRPEKPFRDMSLCYENYYPSNWISI